MTEGSARILIVDDEANIREVLDRGLTRAGYACVTVEAADVAAQLFQQQEFDLVMLDITMPGRSGINFLLEIHARHPDVAVLMLTGIVDVAIAVRAMQEGAYDYLIKPVELPELIVRIEHAQSSRSLRLENRRYQKRLEQLVDELNALIEQRRREITALNRLFQSHLKQDQDAQDAYSHLKESLISFTSELDGLAAIAGIGQDERDGATKQLYGDAGLEKVDE